MTNLHHTPIVTGQAANAANINAPLGELDAAIGALNERIGDVEQAGYSVVTGNVATLTNGAANAGQKSIVVDSSSGFVAGGRIAYVRNDGSNTVEYNVIDAIPDATHLTATTNIGTGGIADNSYVSLIPVSEYMAAQAVNHGNGYEPTLPLAIGNSATGIFNVHNYGATGDGSADDTTAVRAALAAMKAHTASREKRTLLQLQPGKVYKITGGLNLTNCERVTIEGNGATLKSYGVNGKAVLDLTGSAYVEIHNLTFDSDVNTPPGCHILMGRSTDSGGEVSGTHLLHNCRFLGYWTVAAVYNVASEINTYDHCYVLCSGPSTAKYGFYYSGYDDESLTSEFVTRSSSATASTLWVRSCSILGPVGGQMIPLFFGDWAGNLKIDGGYFAAYGVPAIKTYGNIHGLDISTISVEGTPNYALHMTKRGGNGTIKNLRFVGVAATYTSKFVKGESDTTIEGLVVEDCQDASGTYAFDFGKAYYVVMRAWNQAAAATVTFTHLYYADIELISTQTLTITTDSHCIVKRNYTASDPNIETSNLALKPEGGSLLHKVLTTTLSWAIGDVADGAVVHKNFTLTGASSGDCGMASLSGTEGDVLLFPWIYGGGGQVMLLNKTGGVWSGGTRTLRVTVIVAE